MAVIRKPYFGDNQLKRMLVQIMSCFSGYQVMTGTQRDGKSRFRDVPIIYGDMSRVAGYIIGPRGDQDNTTGYLPMLALHMNRLKQNNEYRLNPQHSEKYNFFERARDPDGNLLTGKAGKKKTVERFMPVPYDMGVSLSIWASNNDEGYQLVEQIATIFNPDMDIQLSNSPADWTFLTSLIFDGEIEMEKATPSGGDTDPMYVFKLNFSTVVWMSPPAKVYDTKYIHEIIVPIKELESGLDFDDMQVLDGLVIRATDDDILTFESLDTGKTPTQI
jgi:hypothetical protein